MTDTPRQDDFGALFTQPDYLQALQDSGSASAENGWHAVAEAGPALYLKDHSWGEFVFDFEIAQAYQQAGLNYYPKLLCAVPFTPVSGPRLLGRSGQDLQDRAQQYGASSAHVLFVSDAERQALQQQGWLLRSDLRYQWHNLGYVDFEQFLEALQSKKRKKLRAERRQVANLGLDIDWCCAGDLPASEWTRIYALYASTYTVRGQQPYLNQDCLQAWGQSMPSSMLFCLARQAGEIVAMAFFFRDKQALYGRHWGSAVPADKLHFELCYYQGMEYCIAQGLSIFDAGVQGGHRILRGFDARLTHSAHWFADARFQAALAPALAREREHVQQHLQQAQQHSAYKQLK